MTCLLLALSAVVWAQDFQLFFANNVTDVADFNKIESEGSGLNWREVKNGDISGNQVEVDAVKRMFASTEMKSRDQQRQYWTMRDHSLLCFRINDGEGTTGSYEVEVDDGSGMLTLTTSRYFYTNAPRRDEPLSVRVWRSGKEKASGIHFRYYVYDWDDASLYTFNLDAKRRLTDETYKIEYVLAGQDDSGEPMTESRQLEIRNTRFQSFYVPDNRQLQDVFLMSGENRLRINLGRLHPGTSPYTRYDITTLTPTFVLDKHENRELVNFNALGTGLYEQFDTLYVTVLNERGTSISRATLNVERVDAEGHRIADENARYLGYDSKKKVHQVLTKGHPVYIEVLADNYKPTLYKYPGASDPLTHIVSEELCNATVSLDKGTADANGFTLARQTFYTMNDEKFIVVRGGTDYCFCTEQTHDLGRYVPTDTLYYSETCGNDYPKLLNNQPTERYAQIEIAYSRPPGSGSVATKLTSIEDVSGATHALSPTATEVVSVNEFPTFTRNYYFQRYNLVGSMPENTPCRLHLSSDVYSYDKFPLMVNLYLDREQQQKDADEETQEKCVGDQTDDLNDGFAQSGSQLSIPGNFKFTFKPVKISSSINIDITHQVVNVMVNGKFMPPPGEDPDEEKEAKLSKQRKEAAAAANYGYKEADRDSVSKVNFNDTKVNLSDKVTTNAEDIFAINPLVGTSWFGGFKAGFKIPFDEANGRHFILTEASGNIGYMANFPYPNLIDNYLGNGPIGKIVKKVNCFSFGGQFGGSIQLDIGLRYFGKNEAMTKDNMGYFSFLSSAVKAGVWAQVGIPSNPILNINAGLRAGTKFAFNAGLAGPFDNYAPAVGVELMIYALIEAYANMRTPVWQWSGRAGVHIGYDFFGPNNGHNPFHKDFPYWIKDDKARAIGDIYRAPRRVETSEMGETLLTGVAIDANPHFLDENTVVVNHLGQPDDYNDDHISTIDLTTHAMTNLSAHTAAGDGSPDATLARSHARSKRGSHEVVVYEESTIAVDATQLDDDHAAEQSNDLSNHTRIMSAFRQSDGSWRRLPVSPLNDQAASATDGQTTNAKPMVTIQDDGQAVCVWQRGHSEYYDPVTESDSIYPYAMRGSLVYSYFDGNAWSQPMPLIDVDHQQRAGQYDLVMRGDTVLIGCNVINQSGKPENRNTQFIYFSAGPERLYGTYHEDITPDRFFMNRVGQHAVIAILHEKTDSLKDIFVKTLRMDGRSDGRIGTDIGASFCQPSLMKIVCDRAAENADDFAILWTEMNNVVHEDDGTRTGNDEVRGLLNASRVHLSNSAIHVTAPITLGSDQDDLTIIDYDGVLDDARIRAVYTLADVETGGAVVMTNEKYFHNSFESDVTYTREALIAQDVLPVNVIVRNTGTSAIESVTATINGQDFTIADSYVAPLRQQTFTVAYPIPEDFDGYMTTSVSVVFDNVFRAKAHPRRRAMSFLRQAKAPQTTHIKRAENVEMRLIRQSIEDGSNIFVVELTDHSMRGIDPNNAVAVGLYAHPSTFEPLADEARVIIKADDFMLIGGKRKAYATITIDGITEPTQAFLNAHIADLPEIVSSDPSDNLSDVAQRAQVDNLLGFDNAYRVKLYPTADPTVLKAILADKTATHRISVTTEADGVRLTGLHSGEHIRLFNAEGMTLFSRQATAPELFVPLKTHGVYLVTGDKEVFKFKF